MGLKDGFKKKNEDWVQAKKDWELQESCIERIEDMLQFTEKNSGNGSSGYNEQGRREMVQTSTNDGSALGHRVDASLGDEKWRRLEIPLFSGGGAYGWVVHIERFFQPKGVLEHVKLHVVMAAMEEKALSWFHWWGFCNPNPSWEEFKTAVVSRFHPEMVMNHFELLLGLRQRDSQGTDPEFFKGIFLNGLREDIWTELRLHQVQSIQEMTDLMQRIDEKNKALQNFAGDAPLKSYGPRQPIWQETKGELQPQVLTSNQGKEIGEKVTRSYNWTVLKADEKRNLTLAATCW
ncbi:hypothetical protein CR513_62060, partial [Mucuna pruriens]